MWLNLLFICTILFGSELRLSAAAGNQMNLHMCMANKTLSVQILTSLTDETRCQCIAGPAGDPNIRDDYVHTPGIGAYKLHTNAKTWNDARKICNEENAHLAIINSYTEEAVLLDILKTNASLIRHAVGCEQALLGAHDLFQEGEWVTIFGESLYTSGYARWSTEWYGAQPDNYKGQNCASLVVKGGMDDIHHST